MSGPAAVPGAVDVLTFGCRLNIVESEAMRALAIAAGERDLVIVNTCAVTGEAVRQARQAIRRVKRDRPGARVVVTGCASAIDPDAFAAMPEVERLIDNARKTSACVWNREGPPPEIAAAARGPGTARGLGTAGGPGTAGGRTRGFVEIQNGCDHRCTFCVIPFGRGASRSTPADAVVATVRGMVARGAGEVVLTGVDATSYAADGLALGGLVKRVLAEVPDLSRLRLSSIDCAEADRDLLDVIANDQRFMPHLHLSLQSGSDLILKRMRRRHGSAHAQALCRQVRALRPDIAFGADVIAGFPTETEANARETEAHVEACGIAFLHVFPYSARPNTPAARMPPVPGEVVRERAAKLRAGGERALRRHLDGWVGRSGPVLVERGGRGHLPDFTAVRVGPHPAGLVAVVVVADHNGRELLTATDVAAHR